MTADRSVARVFTAPPPDDTTDDTSIRTIVIGLTRLGLATRHQAWQGAADQGLSPTQGQILALLRYRYPTGARLGEIAGALAITAPTVSDAVRVLGTKGFVEKMRAPDDRRAISITLTPAGQDEAARAAGWSDFLLDAVDALDPDERGVFLRGLVKMIGALQDRGEIPVSRMCTTCRFFRPNAHPGTARPHHCAFVDAPFGDTQFRIECDDHEPAPADQVAHARAALGRTS